VRVIVDTNILISGLISQSGPPAKIIDAILKGHIIPIMSPATFAELEEVLHRPQLQRYFRRVELTPYQLLNQLELITQIIKPRTSHTPIRDNKDRPFIELAATRPAPDFIITGDKDFEENHYENVPVISASLFVKAILE